MKDKIIDAMTRAYCTSSMGLDCTVPTGAALKVRKTHMEAALQALLWELSDPELEKCDANDFFDRAASQINRDFKCIELYQQLLELRNGRHGL